MRAPGPAGSRPPPAPAPPPQRTPPPNPPPAPPHRNPTRRSPPPRRRLHTPGPGSGRHPVRPLPKRVRPLPRGQVATEGSGRHPDQAAAATLSGLGRYRSGSLLSERGERVSPHSQARQGRLPKRTYLVSLGRRCKPPDAGRVDLLLSAAADLVLAAAADLLQCQPWHVPAMCSRHHANGSHGMVQPCAAATMRMAAMAWSSHARVMPPLAHRPECPLAPWQSRVRETAILGAQRDVVRGPACPRSAAPRAWHFQLQPDHAPRGAWIRLPRVQQCYAAPERDAGTRAYISALRWRKTWHGPECPRQHRTGG